MSSITLCERPDSNRDPVKDQLLRSAVCRERRSRTSGRAGQRKAGNGRKLRSVTTALTTAPASGYAPRGKAFARSEESRANLIETVLDPVIPSRVMEIAAAIDHPAERLSANLRDLVRQGRVMKVGFGLYVRAVPA